MKRWIRQIEIYLLVEHYGENEKVTQQPVTQSPSRAHWETGGLGNWESHRVKGLQR